MPMPNANATLQKYLEEGAGGDPTHASADPAAAAVLHQISPTLSPCVKWVSWPMCISGLIIIILHENDGPTAYSAVVLYPLNATAVVK